MNRVRASIFSGSLAVLFAACSISGPGDGAGGSANGGSGGSASGGSGGSAQGGSGGSAQGGSGGSEQGGSGGSGQGGSGGSEQGGSGGSEKGGAGGSVVKGTGGAKGGAGGSVVGGTTTTPTGKGGGTQPPTGTGGVGAGGSTTPPGTGGNPPPANTVVTSANNNFWKSGTLTEATSGTADVTVNDGSALQNWEGMGGAFNELGWSFLTSDALKKEAIDLLFSADGCNFAWGRIPIGASDYAMDRYTCAEGDDTSLSKFSIARDKEKLIPYVKAALAVKPDLKLWASPWTPPTWMKTGQLAGNKPSPFDGGKMKSDDAIVTAHAQYLVKWIQAYKDESIKISVVAPQNEPNFEQNYPTCVWDSGTFVNEIKKLGPALSAAGLDTQVMLGTLSNSDSGKDMSVADAVMADSTAKNIVKMVGVQWGVLDEVAKGKSWGLPVWVSETRCGNYPWNPSGAPKYVEPAPNDYAYAKETWGELKKGIGQGKVVSYNAWNMVLDKMGKGIDTTRQWAQNALLVADGGKLTKTPTYYLFRHISQFAKAGGKVVSLQGGEGFGFKNPDGSIVAVLYTSSAKSNYTVKIGSKLYQFASPADGWSTVMVKP